MEFEIDQHALFLAYRQEHPRITTAQINAYLFAMHRASNGMDITNVREYRKITHSQAKASYIRSGLIDARRDARQHRESAARIEAAPTAGEGAR